MFCKYCGKQIEDDSMFCQYCGKAVTQIEKAEVDTAIHKQPGIKVPKILKVGVIIAISLLLIIGIVAAVRSVSKRSTSIVGVWAYDASSEDNNGSLVVHQYKNIDAQSYIAFQEDGSIRYATSAGTGDMDSYTLMDDSLVWVLPLGTKYYYYYELEKDTLKLKDEKGNCAVFYRCKSIDDARSSIENSDASEKPEINSQDKYEPVEEDVSYSFSAEAENETIATAYPVESNEEDYIVTYDSELSLTENEMLRTDVASYVESLTSSSYEYTKKEIEDEEGRIRNAINRGDTSRIEVNPSEYGLLDSHEYKRWYDYEDNSLIFAYYYGASDGSPDLRFYFKDNRMIEWIYGNDDSNRECYYASDSAILNDKWYDEESKVLFNAYYFLNSMSPKSTLKNYSPNEDLLNGNICYWSIIAVAPEHYLTYRDGRPVIVDENTDEVVRELSMDDFRDINVNEIDVPYILGGNGFKESGYSIVFYDNGETECEDYEPSYILGKVKRDNY